MTILQNKGELKQLTLLAPSIVYDENENTVYFGCDSATVNGYLKTISIFSRCEDMEVIDGKYTDFEKEIVIRDMQLITDTNAYGLDYWTESQSLKYWNRNNRFSID